MMVMDPQQRQHDFNYQQQQSLSLSHSHHHHQTPKPPLPVSSSSSSVPAPASNSNNSPLETDDAKEKRKRQAAACDACRQRKRGCDGKVPCNQCSRKNIPCTFIMERRRQTRKTLEKTDAAAAQGHMVAPHLTTAGVKARNAAATVAPEMPAVDPNLSFMEQHQLFQQQLTVTGNVALVHSDFMVASHTAVMIDLFFEHYTCVFGCICRESLMNPKTRSAEFLQHAVLAVVNRSFGDATAKTHHEQEARRIAALVGDENVDETVQAFLVLAFFYGSENVLLAAQFARMAETALQDAERRMGRTPGLMKLRGLCRSMRCSTDVRALLDQQYHLPRFTAGETPDESDPCVVQRVLMGVLAELLRADQELVHTFFSSNPFQSRIRPGHLDPAKGDNIIAATMYAHGEIQGEMFACLPASARWGILMAIHSMQALALWMVGREEESVSTVVNALRFSRPTASQFLSAKPLVVPHLAALALIADVSGRHDLLLDISNLLLRLGRIFRSAWLGYNEVVARLPVGMAMPNPAPIPHQTFSTNFAPPSQQIASHLSTSTSTGSNSSTSTASTQPHLPLGAGATPSPGMSSHNAMAAAGALAAAQAVAAAQAATQIYQGTIYAHHPSTTTTASTLSYQSPSPYSNDDNLSRTTTTSSTPSLPNKADVVGGVVSSDVSNASTPMFTHQEPGPHHRSEEEEDDDGLVDYDDDSDAGLDGALDAILPQSTLNADAASMLTAEGQRTQKVADPWVAGLTNWDDQAPSDWRDFWLLSQTLAQ